MIPNATGVLKHFSWFPGNTATRSTSATKRAACGCRGIQRNQGAGVDFHGPRLIGNGLNDMHTFFYLLGAVSAFLLTHTIHVIRLTQDDHWAPVLFVGVIIFVSGFVASVGKSLED